MVDTEKSTLLFIFRIEKFAMTVNFVDVGEHDILIKLQTTFSYKFGLIYKEQENDRSNEADSKGTVSKVSKLVLFWFYVLEKVCR